MLGEMTGKTLHGLSATLRYKEMGGISNGGIQH